jgi:hypothetical protein
MQQRYGFAISSKTPALPIFFAKSQIRTHFFRIRILLKLHFRVRCRSEYVPIAVEIHLAVLIIPPTFNETKV